MPSQHLPEVVTLWKTAGWVILSHFEMTLQSLRLRERLSKPHILLRNGAVSAVDWDSRIPVAGEELNVYGEYRASALEGRQFKCQIELSVEVRSHRHTRAASDKKNRIGRQRRGSDALQRRRMDYAEGCSFTDAQ